MERAALLAVDRKALVEVLQREREQHRAGVAAIEAELADLRARLGQDSSNSSRPPSSDPPGTPRPEAATGTRRPGGQPGHAGHHRALLPPERVDQVITLRPEWCADCGAPLAAEAGPDDPAEERHQVVELPALAVVAAEYRLA